MYPALKFITFFILFFNFLTIRAETESQDSIVDFSELIFHSNLEREAFLDYNRTKDFNFFKLYLSIDKKVTNQSLNNYKWVFEKKLKDLNNLNSKKPKKQIKSIYGIIHNQLDKYDNLALFSDIFENQTYQCVTSSMLYALYFDELNIPYSIEFIPGHVYLTAYPETDKIQIQTTDPLKGVFTYNDQFKNNFVNHLKDGKRISTDEYNNKSTDQLFQEYFLQSEKIDKKQLAGALYSNLGIKLLEKSDFLNAYRTYQKSYYLFPSDQTEFLMYISLAALMEQTSASESIYADYLHKFIKLSQNHLNEDLISGLFTNITYKQLHTNGNVRQYELSYEKVISAVSDTSLKDEISFVYHSQMGNIMATRKLYSYAHKHYREALRIKENNFEIQNLLIGSIINEMNILRGDSDKMIEFQSRLMDIIDSIPSVRNNNNISDLKFEIALDLMRYFFQEKQINKAKEQQNFFNEMAKDYNGKFSYLLESEIEEAYSAGAVFYYKNKQTKQAINIIKEGLKYCPDNYKLKLRLEALK